MGHYYQEYCQRLTGDVVIPKILSLIPRIYFKDPGTLATLEAFKDNLGFCTDYELSNIIAAARDALCLLCPAPYPRITKEIINSLPKLKMIQSAGAGYNKIDIEAAAKAGIPVCNAPGLNTEAVAELVLAVIINLQRGLAYADRKIKEGLYQEVREELLARGMEEMNNTKWGIIGLGQIGTRVATLGKQMGVEVSYYNRTRKYEVEERLGINYQHFETVLKGSDAIIISLAYAPETAKLISTSEIKMMKKNAIIVNVGRGGIIDEDALAEALLNERIGGAALDTYEIEPLPGGHSLLKMPEKLKDRIFLTPHLAGVTVQSLNRMLSFSLENCARVLRGEKPLAIVNGVE